VGGRGLEIHTEREILWGFALHQMRMTAKVNAVTDADVRPAVMRPFAKLLWTLVISAAATIQSYHYD